MSQHVPETCNESNGSWLPITEYSVKCGVSLSTIRRKIKSNSIPYRLEKGKYLILFNQNETVSSPPQVTQPVQTPIPAEKPIRMSYAVARNEARVPVRPPARNVQWEEDEPFQMVSDAFEHALKEKEERVKLLEQRNRELEDRLNELRLLVQVLEEKYEVRY